ncbi:hypothetical protein ABT224_36220 [Streptomyces sp. NPDC001584]|uniref:hypothetical protein n=1 Tax=Streptomyces sp. NPDC001584 TaxID=3154521 RepID=UPI003326646C
MRHDVTPSPASLSHEEMADALTAAARLSGSELKRAATHLLTFTGLPGRGDFARHTTLAWAEVPGTGRALTAEVDLTAVRDDQTLYLTGSDEHLLNLALSYSRGRPVHLRNGPAATLPGDRLPGVAARHVPARARRPPCWSAGARRSELTSWTSKAPARRGFSLALESPPP